MGLGWAGLGGVGWVVLVGLGWAQCPIQARQLLGDGRRGPTPVALAQLCDASARLKIHDTQLFELVLAHVMDHWCDDPSQPIPAPTYCFCIDR